jgi:hypothetical protein
LSQTGAVAISDREQSSEEEAAHAIAIAPTHATGPAVVRVTADSAKEVFELALADASGRIVERLRLSAITPAGSFDPRPQQR